MALTKFPINNFRGGLNTRDNPFELTPNESPDLLNVTITSLVGTLKTREGKSRFAAGLPNEKVDHMKQCIIGANKRFLMLSINGSIYSCNENGEVVKRHTGTAGTIWDFEVFADANYKDWVWMVNGVDAPKKWDGEAAEAVEWKATTGALPNGNVLCMWENRLIISGAAAAPQRVYFSEFSDPEATLKEYGFVDVRATEDDLDAVQDIAVLGARLFVLKRRSVFFISSPVTFLNRRIGGPGVYSRFQVAEMEDKLYWFNPQGIWGTAGVAIAMESGSINTWFPKELNPTEAQLKGARLMVTRDTYPRLLLAVATGAVTRNNMLIEMIPHINFRRIGGRRYLLLPAFMLHTIPADSLAAWNPKGIEEQIIGASVGRAPTTFPAVETILDSFERADEDPLTGPKWIIVRGDPRIHNKMLQVGPGALGKYENAEALWNQTYVEPYIISELKKLELLPSPHDIKWEVGLVRKNKLLGEGEWEAWVLLLYVQQNLKGEQENKWYTQVLVPGTGGGTTNVASGTFPTLVVGDAIGLAVTGAFVYVGYRHEGKWQILATVARTKGPIEGRPEITLGQEQNAGEHIGVTNFAVGAPGAEKEPEAEALFRLFHGTTDDGEQINSHWRSAWFPLQEGEARERVRRIDVELQGDAILEVFTDFQEKAAFTGTLPRLGELKEFDEAEEPVKEGLGLTYRFARVRPETYGRYHSIKLSSDSEGTPFTINSAELVYRGGKQH